MQSEKYFQHCSEIVKYYFKLKELTREKLEPESIVMHIRLGDYDDHYHPIQKREYYDRALSILPRGNVYVFSDNPDKARDMLGAQHEYISGNHYMIDFQLMTTGKHFVLSNSTFCWWAWYLADHGMCVAPKKWFGNHVGLDTKDIYTEEMIVL
jgi:hypothetical protein